MVDHSNSIYKRIDPGTGFCTSISYQSISNIEKLLVEGVLQLVGLSPNLSVDQWDWLSIFVEWHADFFSGVRILLFLLVLVSDLKSSKRIVFTLSKIFSMPNDALALEKVNENGVRAALSLTAAAFLMMRQIFTA